MSIAAFSPAVEDPELEPHEHPVETPASVLASAAAVRFPDIRTMRGADRIEALVDHITETALARGDVEELRLEAHVQLLATTSRLNAMPAAGRNRAATDEARRAAAPDLAAEQDRSRWVIDRCKEQVNRLDADYDAASRVYTLLSGS